MPPRCYLFVPATRPDRFERALASGADAVIIDLEDAVAAHHKPTARIALQQWLAARAADAPRVIVRMESPFGPFVQGGRLGVTFVRDGKATRRDRI